MWVGSVLTPWLPLLFAIAQCNSLSLSVSQTNNLSDIYANATRAVFKVLRIFADNEDTLKKLHQLRIHEDEYNLDFWKPPRSVGENVDVMVPPEYTDAIPDLLNVQNISFNTIIPDVEQLIKKTESRVHGFESDRMRQRDDAEGRPSFDFRAYNSYSDMVRYMKYLSDIFPDICKFMTIGKTHDGRYIHGVKIGYPLNERKKRMVWIDGGIHAREWASGHTVMFFIHQLVSQYKRDKEIKLLVDNLTWYIFPMVNPDGYEHSRSSSIPNIRMWRKNRSPGICTGEGFRKKCCKGVDLNRNFDWHWMETDTSKNPCSIIYGGPSAMSEPEAQAIGKFVLRRKSKIDMFITIHTYGQLWLHSFGHKRAAYPKDVDEVAAVGKRAAYALQQVYGTKFKVGSGADALYPSSGGSDDWAKGKAKIKYTYLLELRPDDQNMAGFILKEEQLLPTAVETWEGVKVVAKRVILRARKLAKLVKPKAPAVSRRRNGVSAGLNSARSTDAFKNARRSFIKSREMELLKAKQQRKKSIIVPRPAPPPPRTTSPPAPVPVSPPPPSTQQARFIIRTTTPAPQKPVPSTRIQNDARLRPPPRRAPVVTRSRTRPPSSTEPAQTTEVNDQLQQPPTLATTMPHTLAHGTATTLIDRHTTTNNDVLNSDQEHDDLMTQIQEDMDIIMKSTEEFEAEAVDNADFITDWPVTDDHSITATTAQMSTNSPANLESGSQHASPSTTTITEPSSRRRPSPCADTQRHCKTWIENNPNLCYVSKNSMKEQCEATCGFC